MQPDMLTALSLFLAGLVGFAIHRAGLCTVRAMGEILTTRRVFMLSALGKTVLWVAAITMAMLLLLGDAKAPGIAWAISLHAVVGGLAFGIGAALNRGCAFSTLARLANGEASMVLALAGFCLGAIVAHLGVDWLALPPREPLTPTYGGASAWLPVALITLTIWTAWEAFRLWRTRLTSTGWTKLVLARIYRLSTAAALLGVTNGALYALHGPWAYSSTLASWAQSLALGGPPPDWQNWALAGALILGSVASAWQRGSIRPDWRPSKAWVTNAAGGTLMGFGAAMAPGGNDALIQHHVPGLSPHALPAFGAMLLGVAVALVVIRMITGRPMIVDCRGDFCREV